MNANAEATKPLFSLQDRIVVVAGGGSVAPGWSIGRAACVTYARLGAIVCVLDRDLRSAEETVEIIAREGRQASAHRSDMSSELDVKATFKSLLEMHGQIDVLHHNVGIGKTGGPMETSAEDLDRIHAVNVKSLMLCCQQVLPSMVERRTGSIISIASVAGIRYVGYPHLAYSTTKAAVVQMTKMIAQQYADKGVRANSVVPGLIDTPRIAVNVAHAFADSLERSGAGNLDSLLGGNSGHNAGPKGAGHRSFDGQEISAAHPPHPHAGFQGAGRLGGLARRQDVGRSGQAV